MYRGAPVETSAAPRRSKGCPGPSGRKQTAIQDRVVPLSEQLATTVSRTNNPRSLMQLVGSGPGDPSLMTIAAHRAVSEAEVILADKLAPPDILKLSPPHCEVIFARKFPGNAAKAQQELNERGLACLRANKRVVRLKGGDPFVYGRGGEEYLWYKRHGFKVEIIPGVSSALVAPLSACIPVTHRGVANQLLLLTGQSKEGGLPELPQWQKGRTTVVLMGLGKLEGIMEAASRRGMFNFISYECLLH